MPIFSVKTFKSAIETSQIYKKFEKHGKIIYHYYPKNDTLQKELQEISNLYKAHPTKSLKKHILNIERKILYQELENPELTLARNGKEILKGVKRKLNFDKFFAWIQGLNMDGIYRIEAVLRNRFASKLTTPHANKIKSTFISLKENNLQAIQTKQLIIKVFSWHRKLDILKKLSKSTKSKELKTLIKKQTTEYTYDFITEIKKLKQNPFQAKKLKAFFINLENEPLKAKETKTKRKFASKIIKDILSNKNISAEIKILAVWGAGKYKSDTAFKVIKQIALNNNEKDIRLREMALHSIALYAKNKPQEVRKILSTVEKDGSIFSPLARILQDVANGTFLRQKNREYQYLNINSKEMMAYKNKINELLKIIGIKTNTKMQNAIDRSMLFYRKIFPILKKETGYIIDDTATKVDLQVTGTRNLGAYPKTNRGNFHDTSLGCHNYDKKYVIATKNDFCDDQYNTLAHEYGHCWHYQLSKTDFLKLRKLYQKAIKAKKTINDYAALNEYEYFAVGCEAMASIYKPHSEFIKIYNYCSHTKYELLKKDPELYHFIEEMMQKYSK